MIPTSKNVLLAFLLLAGIGMPEMASGNEPLSQPDSLSQAGPDSGTVAQSEAGDSLLLPQKPMPLALKIVGGIFVFGLVEGGVFLHSAAFAASPVGGSIFAGVAGLLAAINSDPETAKITFAFAGSLIAYNLIRFGPEMEVSESRSPRIFTENAILMHVGMVASYLTSTYLDKQKSAKKKSSVSLHFAPDGAGINRSWTF